MGNCHQPAPKFKGTTEALELSSGDTLNLEATRASDRKVINITLEMVEELGRGAFGVVNRMTVMAEDDEEPMEVAVKLPGEDGTLAEVECYLLQKIEHENVVALFYYFAGIDEDNPNVNLVLELVPGVDLFHYLKENFSVRDGLGIYLEIFTYQLFRALAYCHNLNIVHRDLKPENALVDPETGILKLADFGCGTELDDPEAKHTFYIGTRIFRSPELLLGASRYTTKVDIWSAGVMITEMALGMPLFFGSKEPKAHLLNIFQFCGIPTEDDFVDMKIKPIPLPDYVKEKSLKDKLRIAPPISDKDLLLDLLEGLLVYSPEDRLAAWDVCNHEFFAFLAETSSLPNDNPLPQLFNFSPAELSSMPRHVRENLGAIYPRSEP